MDKAGKVFSIVFLVIFFIALANSYMDCSEKGGTSVRGLFWLECVNVP